MMSFLQKITKHVIKPKIFFKLAKLTLNIIIIKSFLITICMNASKIY